MAKEKSKFVCKECGTEHPKWQGKCDGCGQWNLLEESTYFTGKAAKGAKTIITEGSTKRPLYLREIEKSEYEGFSSRIEELDRVLGGKIVNGSFVLIGGQPGYGKSTLLLQTVDNVSEHVGKVIYFSGEESEFQTKLRAERLKVDSENLMVMHTRDIDAIEKMVDEYNPVLIVVDSIQTVGDSSVTSEPGSIAQIKMCTARLMNIAKEKGVTTFVVGQVTKDSNIAGPKLLEHMVDVVLYLEGEKYNDLRLLRVNKNRFGSTSELGVFQMVEEGLEEVKNPSEFLLSNRLPGANGSVITCIADTRPLLIEIQGLVAPLVQQAIPRRTSVGFDRNRLTTIVAVLEKHCGVGLTWKDVYVNVVSGMEIDEPSADLAVAMALVSSDLKVETDPQTVIVGEIGLTGEVRPVPNAEQLVKEAERQGFNTFILPKKNYERIKDKFTGLNLHPVVTVKDAMKQLFGTHLDRKAKDEEEDDE